MNLRIGSANGSHGPSMPSASLRPRKNRSASGSACVFSLAAGSSQYFAADSSCGCNTCRSTTICSAGFSAKSSKPRKFVQRSIFPTYGRHRTAAIQTKFCGAQNLPRGFHGSPACCAFPVTSAEWTSRPTRRHRKSSRRPGRFSLNSAISIRRSRPAARR